MKVLVDLVPINVVDWNQIHSIIDDWATQKTGRYICICNAHSIATARQDGLFREALLNADLTTPDGAPIAWMMRRLGQKQQVRISGPDLMWKYCSRLEKINGSIYLYGSSISTLEKIKTKIKETFPNLIIAGSYSPPFRDLSEEEDTEVVKNINASGANIVWVSLGCPKQEKWMAAHKSRVNSVMIGVGAAFDFHAGTIKRAPLWMQKNGLEWLHRLCSEPRRLWKRYFFTNSIFILLAFRQLIYSKMNSN